MTTFGTLGIAASGMTVDRKWLDAVSDNLANIDTARSTSQPAYEAKYVVASEMPGGGVQVAGAVTSGNATGRVVYEPDNPLADAQGNVRYPDVDMSSQMVQLIMAQRGYQANAAVVDRAKDAYESALKIGQNL